MSNERGPPFLLIRWDRRQEPLVPAPDRSGLACAERGRADDGRRAGQAFVSLASSCVVAAPWTRWRWWCVAEPGRIRGLWAVGSLALSIPERKRLHYPCLLILSTAAVLFSSSSSSSLLILKDHFEKVTRLELGNYGQTLQLNNALYYIS